MHCTCKETGNAMLLWVGWCVVCHISPHSSKMHSLSRRYTSLNCISSIWSKSFVLSRNTRGIRCPRRLLKYNIAAAITIFCSSYESLFGIVEFIQFTTDVLWWEVSRYAFILVTWDTTYLLTSYLFTMFRVIQLTRSRTLRENSRLTIELTRS